MLEALLIIGAVVLLFVFLFFTRKDMSKRALIKGSLLNTTEDNEKITLNTRSQEESEQRERLLSNKAYRILDYYLQAEIKRIEAYSLDEARKVIPKGTSTRIVEDQLLKVVIRLDVDLPGVKVTVYPKTLFGFLGAAGQWVYLK